MFFKKILNVAKVPGKKQFYFNKNISDWGKTYLTLCAFAYIFAGEMCYLSLQKIILESNNDEIILLYLL